MSNMGPRSQVRLFPLGVFFVFWYDGLNHILIDNFSCISCSVHSSRVVCAFMESSDAAVQKLARKELQPLIDGGILKLPENKQLEKQVKVTKAKWDVKCSSRSGQAFLLLWSLRLYLDKGLVKLFTEGIQNAGESTFNLWRNFPPLSFLSRSPLRNLDQTRPRGSWMTRRVT